MKESRIDVIKPLFQNHPDAHFTESPDGHSMYIQVTGSGTSLVFLERLRDAFGKGAQPSVHFSSEYFIGIYLLEW